MYRRGVPRLNEADRSQRRQHLIDAAWRCATRKGYANTTVDDVCDEAESSKGAFYLCFESKQDLLLALLDEDAGRVDRRMEELEKLNLTQGERVRRFARWMVERGSEAGRGQVQADLWASALTDEAVRARFSEVVGRRRARLRAWIEAGVAEQELIDIPANALASVLLSLEDGLLLHAAIDSSAFRWERIRRALTALLAGLQISPAQRSKSSAHGRVADREPRNRSD